MYPTLLALHALFRWLLLAALVTALLIALNGYRKRLTFTATANALRHWTATIAHVQLVIGILLYIKSPVAQLLWKNFRAAAQYAEPLFFGIWHVVCMIIAVVVLTIGSAIARRKSTDREKYSTMLKWFLFALLLIFIAIPWPFSPFANRPYFRAF